MQCGTSKNVYISGKHHLTYRTKLLFAYHVDLRVFA